jgi:hypothetical protein
MTQTPIHRIPLEADSPALHAIVKGELNSLNLNDIPVGDSLAQLIDHDGNADSLNCCMDWAMQIRAELGIDWGAAIQAAMVLFYG